MVLSDEYSLFSLFHVCADAIYQVNTRTHIILRALQDAGINAAHFIIYYQYYSRRYTRAAKNCREAACIAWAQNLILLDYVLHTSLVICHFVRLMNVADIIGCRIDSVAR